MIEVEIWEISKSKFPLKFLIFHRSFMLFCKNCTTFYRYRYFYRNISRYFKKFRRYFNEKVIILKDISVLLKYGNIVEKFDNIVNICLRDMLGNQTILQLLQIYWPSNTETILVVDNFMLDLSGQTGFKISILFAC